MALEIRAWQSNVLDQAMLLFDAVTAVLYVAICVALNYFLGKAVVLVGKMLKTGMRLLDPLLIHGFEFVVVVEQTGILLQIFRFDI
mgnify:CR=1 FL=1